MPRAVPFGLVTLGTIEDLEKQATHFPSLRLLLANDARGWFAVETLTPQTRSLMRSVRTGERLLLQNANGGGSLYNTYGELVTSAAPLAAGTAEENQALRRFRLIYGSSALGGQPATVQVVLGYEVDSDWRLSHWDRAP